MSQFASQRRNAGLTLLSLAASLMFGACADESTDPSAERESGSSVLAQETAAAEPDASVAAPDASQPRWAQREDQGVGNGRDVIMMGDSWMSGPLCFSGACQQGINEAITATGKKYRNYAVSATQLSTGAIPDQFTQALRANKDIKTVIMTGGGNDVLIGQNRGAKAAELITNELNKLWTKMSEAGVKDVVYIQYSSSAGNAVNGGTKVNDNAPPPVIPICQTGPIICHSVPTSDLVTAKDLMADQIHPNKAANKKIAARVLELLEAHKIRR